MALKKSQLYSSLWASCDELRGGMDASQYKDYVLVLLFVKYVSDRYAGQPYAAITILPGASFADMVTLKGKPDIGDQINKKILGPLGLSAVTTQKTGGPWWMAYAKNWMARRRNQHESVYLASSIEGAAGSFRQLVEASRALVDDLTPVRVLDAAEASGVLNELTNRPGSNCCGCSKPPSRVTQNSKTYRVRASASCRNDSG